MTRSCEKDTFYLSDNFTKLSVFLFHLNSKHGLPCNTPPPPPKSLLPGAQISFTHTLSLTQKAGVGEQLVRLVPVCVCVGWFRCWIRTMIGVVNHSEQVKSKSLSHPLTAHQGLSVYSASQQREKTSLSRRPLLFPSDYHWRTHTAVLTPLC